MLDRIRWAVTRFIVKYGTDWEKEHADTLAAIQKLQEKKP